MSETFFTGCTHFGHANIIKLCNRPFGDVGEMNEALIQNWNKVVGPKDEIFHLGDFFFWHMKDAEIKKIRDRLNGSIISVRGNHDKWGPAEYIEVEKKGRQLVLFHYPIEEWNGFYKGAIHLHCHTHSKIFRSGERRFNVGVDANGFEPVHIDHILSHPGAAFKK